MKLKELKTKSASELAEILHEQKERLRALRFETDSGRLKNVRELRNTRKEIARILTLLRLKEDNG